jgi:CheY-like chemotaxis protein
MHKTILVVEDQADLRDMLQGLLTEDDVEVACAADGQDALSYLSQHEPPDLILLDFNMPNMDGFEFRGRQLKDHRIRHVPVVFLTAIEHIPGQRDDEREVHCLKKPIDHDELMSVVRKYLARADTPPVARASTG